MTSEQEEKMREDLDKIVATIPVIEEQLKNIWRWVSGDNGFNEGAAEILRRHELFIQEQIANKKSNRKLIAEKLAYLASGTVLALITWGFMSLFGG
jgi:hypothetical protein